MYFPKIYIFLTGLKLLKNRTKSFLYVFDMWRKLKFTLSFVIKGPPHTGGGGGSTYKSFLVNQIKIWIFSICWTWKCPPPPKKNQIILWGGGINSLNSTTLHKIKATSLFIWTMNLCFIRRIDITYVYFVYMYLSLFISL